MDQATGFEQSMGWGRKMKLCPGQQERALFWGASLGLERESEKSALLRD
jgi:hypothetical protein